MNIENENVQANENELTANPTETLESVDGYYAISTTGFSAVPAFTSLNIGTPAGKKMLYKITNRPDYNISEFVNKEIRVKDIYVDVNQRLNKDKDSENYGSMEEKPRTILIDVDGNSYIAGVSIGVFQAIREIIRIFGTPDTWDEPLTVRPVTVKTPRGNMLSLEVV